MKKFLPHIALSLFAAELLLMLVSWLWSAAFPMSGVRSLLSSEGVRWLLGHFAELLAEPLLVWLLLCSMAYGCLMQSGLLRRRQTFREGQHTYRESRALLFSLLFLTVYVAVLLLLTVMPHAVLLSATGRLFPSPFSRSLVPVLAFGLMLFSCIYGMIAGRLDSLSTIYAALLAGLRSSTPLLLFYVLVMQLLQSLRFVFP